MNFLKRLFGPDRRTQPVTVEHDRRNKGIYRKWRDSAERLDSAVDMLNRTVTMNASDFAALLQKERERELSLVHDSPWNHVEFVTFAESCEYHKPREGGTLVICTNKEHPGADTRVAMCSRHLCPLGRKK